ncbi:helix-turn-helix domain-containing protein [Pyxidicoccus sp. 3LFB2]
MRRAGAQARGLHARRLQAAGALPLPGQRARAAQRAGARRWCSSRGPRWELQALEPRGDAAPSASDPDAFVVPGPPRPLEEVERLYVRHVLARLDGRRMEAARSLGLSYPTFLRRLGEE